MTQILTPPGMQCPDSPATTCSTFCWPRHLLAVRRVSYLGASVCSVLKACQMQLNGGYGSLVVAGAEMNILA